MAWTRGAAEIRDMIQRGDLEGVVPDENLAATQIARAKDSLAAARDHVDSHPGPALTNAYDAARQSLTAMLEHQGLRPSGRATHLTVQRAAEAQIGGEIGQKFRALRLTRHETEYPSPGSEDITARDAREAVAFATMLIPAVEALMGQMRVFR